MKSDSRRIPPTICSIRAHCSRRLLAPWDEAAPPELIYSEFDLDRRAVGLGTIQWHERRRSTDIDRHRIAGLGRAGELKIVRPRRQIEGNPGVDLV